MTHHLLLAGCGDIGTALGERAARDGWHATGIRRRTDGLPGPISPLQLDLTEPGGFPLPAAEAVVITLTADGRTAADYERTYLGALRGLHRGFQAGGGIPGRVVLVSSTSVLGEASGLPEGRKTGVLTEEAVPRPVRETAKVLLRAEHLAEELFPGAIIVRPAGIYGPGRTSLINRVRRGEALDHTRITNRIHRDDLVAALHAVLDAPRPPSLLHAVDREPARLGDVATYLAGRLGVPVPPDSSRPGAEPAGKVLDGTRLREVVGALRYPTYREGYDAVLADLG
ncbi:NAD-dependent dehydratase [Kocuria coralli]|uniref:NAD-dependent dehydratase n=1 Tax=Kocuria coralli TaxID=1461025 RepID=A0A5J5KYX7_9MICC|nr:NAD-dependent dehydratase [Kocuria coralli]KAA9394823.1 NAD-dependent dehydratase [Kocuria coralli]